MAGLDKKVKKWDGYYKPVADARAANVALDQAWRAAGAWMEHKRRQSDEQYRKETLDLQKQSQASSDRYRQHMMDFDSKQFEANREDVAYNRKWQKEQDSYNRKRQREQDSYNRTRDRIEDYRYNQESKYRRERDAYKDNRDLAEDLREDARTSRDNERHKAEMEAYKGALSSKEEREKLARQMLADPEVIQGAIEYQEATTGQQMTPEQRKLFTRRLQLMSPDEVVDFTGNMLLSSQAAAQGARSGGRAGAAAAGSYGLTSNMEGYIKGGLERSAGALAQARNLEQQLLYVAQISGAVDEGGQPSLEALGQLVASGKAANHQVRIGDELLPVSIGLQMLPGLRAEAASHSQAAHPTALARFMPGYGTDPGGGGPGPAPVAPPGGEPPPAAPDQELAQAPVVPPPAGGDDYDPTKPGMGYPGMGGPIDVTPGEIARRGALGVLDGRADDLLELVQPNRSETIDPELLAIAGMRRGVAEKLAERMNLHNRPTGFSKKGKSPKEYVEALQQIINDPVGSTRLVESYMNQDGSPWQKSSRVSYNTPEARLAYVWQKLRGPALNKLLGHEVDQSRVGLGMIRSMPVPENPMSPVPEGPPKKPLNPMQYAPLWLLDQRQ